MTEDLQADYLDIYEGIQEEIHLVSQFDESSDVSTTCLGNVNMTREDFLGEQRNFHLQIRQQQ